MKIPFITFITTKAYSIEPQVFYKNSQNEKIEIYHYQDNVLNFGRV